MKKRNVFKLTAFLLLLCFLLSAVSCTIPFLKPQENEPATDSETLDKEEQNPAPVEDDDEEDEEPPKKEEKKEEDVYCELQKYTIIYPNNGDLALYYTAMCLSDYFLNELAIEIPYKTDAQAESAYEILIGRTNRQASLAVASRYLQADEFLIAKSENQVVFRGNNYMCAGAAGYFVKNCIEKIDDVYAVHMNTLKTLNTASALTQKWEETENVILLIGDGMGRNQVLKTVSTGKIRVWEGDRLPGQAYCTTRSRSVELGSASYTDSAAAATALATGYKTINGYVGLNENKKSVKNVRELAEEVGAKTAILTTDKITGATPSGFLVHVDDRNNTTEIEKQQKAITDAGVISLCKGSLGDSLFDYTREDLWKVSKCGSRFFTMIEESEPDHGGHNNDMDAVVLGVKRLNECVAYAAAFTLMHPDTALIVTADHETGGIELGTNGKYHFTVSTHTNTNVPVYAIGSGIDTLLAEDLIDNLDIARFMASVYGAEAWGQE